MAPCDEPSALEGQEPSHRSDADEDLSMSPAKSKPPQQRNVEPPNRGNYHNKQNARDEALRRELESVRQVNKAIETAIGSLAKARNSMEVGSCLWRGNRHAVLLVNVTRSKELIIVRQSVLPSRLLHGFSRSGPRFSHKLNTIND